jgi:hypothetical protein
MPKPSRRRSRGESPWDQIALDRLHATLDDSHVFLALFTDAWRQDPTCLLQLGYAIMLGKPLYFAVPMDAVLPRGIARLADGIERYAGPEDYSLAVQRLLALARANGHLSPDP